VEQVDEMLERDSTMLDMFLMPGSDFPRKRLYVIHEDAQA
jgi:hypothetical protein